MLTPCSGLMRLNKLHDGPFDDSYFRCEPARLRPDTTSTATRVHAGALDNKGTLTFQLIVYLGNVEAFVVFQT